MHWEITSIIIKIKNTIDVFSTNEKLTINFKYLSIHKLINLEAI